MRSTAVLYAQRNDLPSNLDRLDLLNQFDVVGLGGGLTADEVNVFVDKLPGKTCLAYTIWSDLNPQDLASYPGPIAKHVPSGSPYKPYPGVGPHIGLINDACVKWIVERAAAKIGNAHGLISDNSNPWWTNWQPGVSFDGTNRPTPKATVQANWQEYVVKIMAALREMLGPSRFLVPNSGISARNYPKYCEQVNGVIIEGVGTPADYIGTYRSPRMSIALAGDAASWAYVQNMALPSGVLAGVEKHVVVMV